MIKFKGVICCSILSRGSSPSTPKAKAVQTSTSEKKILKAYITATASVKRNWGEEKKRYNDFEQPRPGRE